MTKPVPPVPPDNLSDKGPQDRRRTGAADDARPDPRDRK